MWKAQINLTRTTWSVFKDLLQNIFFKEVDEAYKIALTMYNNPEIFTLDKKINLENFDALAQIAGLNDFKKTLIKSNCLNAASNKFFKPTKYYFEQFKIKSNTNLLGCEIVFDSIDYQINLNIQNNPITNPIFKIFKECFEQVSFPTRNDSRFKGFSCWSEETKQLLFKLGPNPYLPSNLFEEKPQVKTFLSKETHEQTVEKTNDKFLF